VAIGADRHLEHEVAHEHAIELRWADRASECLPACRSCRRDEPADGRGGLRVEAGAPVMALAQGAAKAEHIGPKRQQAGHVRRLEPAGEPAHQTPAPAQRRRTGQACRIGVIEQPAARLVGNVEHGAGKPGIGQGTDQVARSAPRSASSTAISRVSRQGHQGQHRLVERRQWHQDRIDARCRHRNGLDERWAGSAGSMPTLALTRRRPPTLLTTFGGPPRQARRARRRIGEIDDVGTGGNGDLGLFGAGHGGEHQVIAGGPSASPAILRAGPLRGNRLILSGSAGNRRFRM
jgi:hypothetical protein